MLEEQKRLGEMQVIPAATFRNAWSIAANLEDLETVIFDSLLRAIS